MVSWKWHEVSIERSTHRIRKCQKVCIRVIFLYFGFRGGFHVIDCCAGSKKEYLDEFLCLFLAQCIWYTCARVFDSINEETKHNQKHRTDIQAHTSCPQHYDCIIKSTSAMDVFRKIEQ